MKKLRMAAAIVCAAASVQAAAFTWMTSSVGAISDATLLAGLAAGTTYGADAMNDIDTAGWTVAYTLTLTDGADTDTLTGTLVTDGFSGGVYDDTMMSDLVVGGKDINYTLTYTASIVDGQSKDWDLTSNVMSGIWHTEDMGDITFGFGEPTSWSTPGSSVPEPTSGLLLLLGVAGLALRRKHA